MASVGLATPYMDSGGYAPSRLNDRSADNRAKDAQKYLQVLAQERLPWEWMIDQLIAYVNHGRRSIQDLSLIHILSIDDAKLETATAVQLATVAGIAFDKSQLTRGLATQVNVSVLLDLRDAIRDMRDRPAVQVIDNEANDSTRLPRAVLSTLR